MRDYTDDFARADAAQQQQDEATRLATFDVDGAIWIGTDDNGFHVYLTADPTGLGYLLHTVVDNDSYCATTFCDRIQPTYDARSLAKDVQDTCDGCADTVREWGLRRPGTSKLGRVIRQMVREAMLERADLDAEIDARGEQDRQAREWAI